METHTSLGFTCQVFPADCIRVQSGANLFDAIGDIDAVCLGDVYQLDHRAQAATLRLAPPRTGTDAIERVQRILSGSDIGAPGDEICVVARLTLMGADARMLDVLIFRFAKDRAAVFAMPLGAMLVGLEYTLIQASAGAGDVPLTQMICVSFTRGTQILLPDGSPSPVEALAPGVPVLTRDHGPQPVRWVGRATLRAEGSMAPVVITAGTLGNVDDLIVSQHQRVFLYQRQRLEGLDGAEVLVQAKHLVDDRTVFVRPGGFVDYFSLVFDRHEIIYAEGVPIESLMVTPQTLAQLPDTLAADLREKFAHMAQEQHVGIEAGANLLARLGRGRVLGKGLMN